MNNVIFNCRTVKILSLAPYESGKIYSFLLPFLRRNFDEASWTFDGTALDLLVGGASSVEELTRIAREDGPAVGPMEKRKENWIVFRASTSAAAAPPLG